MSAPETRVNLEVLRQAISWAAGPQWEVESHALEIFDGVVVTLSRATYAHKLADWDEEVRIPATWFQHLRKSLGLSHRSHAVRFTVTRRRTYPDLPVLPSRYAGEAYVREDRVRNWGVADRPGAV